MGCPQVSCQDRRLKTPGWKQGPGGKYGRPRLGIIAGTRSPTLPPPRNPGSAPPSAPGLDIDGLYRISGNLATIQKLRYKVDHGEARPHPLPQSLKAREGTDLPSILPSSGTDERLDLDDGRWEDVHVITGALKLFFRELPEPLFPFSHFRQFIAAISEHLGQVGRMG